MDRQSAAIWMPSCLRQCARSRRRATRRSTSWRTTSCGTWPASLCSRARATCGIAPGSSSVETCSPWSRPLVVTLTLVAGVSGVLWQASKAQARYHDLRRLTNSLLFELYDVVQQLPGSITAQRMLVTTALDHLDKLARETNGDPLLKGDLVDAYLKLGNLQGNPYEANIGDVEGGLKSLGKALSLAQELARNDTNYEGVARAEQSIGEVLFGMGRTQEAVDHTRRACAAFEGIAQKPGAGAAALFAAAGCYDSLGDQSGQTGTASLGDASAARANYDRAISLDRRAIESDPTFIRPRRAIAVVRMKIAQIVVETNPDEAVRMLREGLGIFESLPAEEKQKMENRRVSATFSRRIAGALASSGDYDGGAGGIPESDFFHGAHRRDRPAEQPRSIRSRRRVE